MWRIWRAACATKTQASRLECHMSRSFLRIPLPAALLVTSALGLLACGGPLGRADGDGDVANIDVISKDDSSRRSSLSVGTDAATGESVCGATLAEDTFRFGLCVCGDLNLAGRLSTEPLVLPGAPSALAGGLAVTGDFDSAGRTDVAGSLVVGGDFAPVGTVTIDNELQVRGDADVVGGISVANDAYVQGELSAIGLSVGGTLYTTAEVTDTFFLDASAAEVADFEVAMPCGCEAADFIGDFIAQAAADNDNGDLDPDALLDVVGSAELALEAGRYYLRGVSATGELSLGVSGSSALYIDGGLELTGRMNVTLAEDAELNIFIANGIDGAGDLAINVDGDPSRLRIYVGGEGPMDLAGGLAIEGALYAPRARLSAAGQVEINGAATVAGIDAAGSVTVRYDTNLIDTDSSCEPTDDGAADDGATDDGAADDGAADDGAADDGATDDGAADDGTCALSTDCPSGQACLDGQCGFIPL